MTPISSPCDVRLVTLIGVAMNVIESLALATDTDPDKILAEHLYLTNKRVHEIGEDLYLEDLTSNYPLLQQAIS